MITCELKDKILCGLVTGAMERAMETQKEGEKYGIDTYTYEAILNQFEKLGFINQKHYFGDAQLIKVTVDAHDFWRRGGFTVQEEILKGNIEKLGWELERLSQDLPNDFLDKAQKLSAIGNMILSALNFMK